MKSMGTRRVAGCLLLMLGLSAFFLHSNSGFVPTVHASSRSISLVAQFPYWNGTNPTITVTKGDSVSITVSRSDSASHELLIDFDGDGVSDTADCGTVDVCSNVIGPTDPMPAFVANTSGNFTYFCTYHPTYMYGTFQVRSSSASPDFSVTATPSSTSIVQGTNANSTITISSIAGFSGTISLSASASPSGPNTSFQPNPVTISSGPATS